MKSFVIGTTVGILAVALPAFGQASYEIAYTFNDEPEVVRVEPEPFYLLADATELPDGVRSQVVVMSFPFADSSAGLAAVGSGQRFSTTGPQAEALIRGRTAATFADFVFSGEGSGFIEVDLRVLFGSVQVLIPSGDGRIGMEYLFEVEAKIASQQYDGASKIVILDGDRGYSRERSGFLDDLPDDRVATIRGIEVPLNEPVSIRIELAASALRPEGSRGTQMSINRRIPETGFPIDRDVFVVPDGVRVDSLQARIEDNRWRFCQADLDHDGELTLFDFLEFRRLFDASDAKADFDGDDALTVFDFLAFQNRFDAGCRFDI